MLKETVKSDLNKSIKESNEIMRSTLRMVLAAVSNKEKEKRYKEKAEAEVQLTEEEMIEVISSEAKKRKEAIREYEKGGRQDLHVAVLHGGTAGEDLARLVAEGDALLDAEVPDG